MVRHYKQKETSAKDSHSEPAENIPGGQDWIENMLVLLTNSRLPDDFAAALRSDPKYQDNQDYQRLLEFLLDLRELSLALSKGDLQKFVTSKGFVLSNLKAHQSNLRHLTWQTKMVAQGDFSQRVDFLGEFSDSFNEMTVKLQESSERLFKMATVDTLTQMPNRRALDHFLIESFRMARKNNTPLSILTFDVDSFKLVNDTYGHDVGDMVLVKISKILNSQFRINDIFSRFGGEEFMAVLPGTRGDDAERIAWRALGAVEKAKISINGSQEISVTVSAGLSELREGDESQEDIIKRSDNALYVAKRTGKNRVCIV